MDKQRFEEMLEDSIDRSKMYNRLKYLEENLSKIETIVEDLVINTSKTKDKQTIENNDIWKAIGVKRVKPMDLRLTFECLKCSPGVTAVVLDGVRSSGMSQRKCHVCGAFLHITHIYDNNTGGELNIYSFGVR